MAWEGVGPFAATHPRAGEVRSLWTFVPSVVFHVLLLWFLAGATTGRPIQPIPVKAIEVELVDQTEYDDSFEVPPEVASRPLAAPTPAPAPDAVPPAPADGLTVATELYSSRVLSDPQNRQVRETLQQLENTERITQLCVIEGLEQLRVARPGPLPDSIAPSAFAPTLLRGLTLEAPGAAFRAARRWYGLRFTCTVSRDLVAVSAYRFAIGDSVPRQEWEAYDLIAEDEDE